MATALPASDLPRSPPLWRQLQLTAKMVRGVRAGHSLATLMPKVPSDVRPGVQALTFDVLRHLGRASAVRDWLVSRKPPAEADALLCTALALMLPDNAERYALHTLADQAVEAAKRDPGTRNQSGLVNACIRRLARERDHILSAVDDDPVARWNYPEWWIKRLRSDHPHAWQDILLQSQRPAPMVLRVNRLRASVAGMLSEFGDAGIDASSLGGDAIQLARPLPVSAIPGFDQGRLSVQSGAAQRAAPLLMAELATDAPRVLDACAAPGGKTAHLLELCERAQVTALEVDPGRGVRITETLERLGLRADVRVVDAAAVAEWWDGRCYDRIMLDAPCSASGIVRRHPDIRWLRRAGDIAQLAAQQDRLLQAMWPLLAPHGRLLYVTCSVFREEGEDRIDAFLAARPDARLLPSPGHVLPIPHTLGSAAGENAACDDGFFYALLEKRPG